eukprot:UN24574
MFFVLQFSVFVLKNIPIKAFVSHKQAENTPISKNNTIKPNCAFLSIITTYNEKNPPVLRYKVFEFVYGCKNMANGIKNMPNTHSTIGSLHNSTIKPTDVSTKPTW